MTRADLAQGVQACQVAHAALEFALAHSHLVTEWHTHSNTLVVLAAPDELDLARCYADANSAGLCVVAFYEPDLGGALTAVALEPGAHRLVAHLPLALADGEEVRT
ncbi:peptidyl-tRNA hydrolase [Actinophytocola sp.]|uniref:peptidyl-tRNA hydrolase n=1 Tax=Actinophytocola sp. TaxID=1872138 RepID=UPI002D808246|nr:peptidyl-tRNA hydrolase [Actinophytocola sp.]HET9141254.1 peptidyl-tRNA hydrolase [Actinophytocola sp.]